jgi:hypothetical protein
VTSSAPTPIKTAYAQRIDADLEKNRAKQEETTKAIASLQERLEQLKSDEQLLVRMRDSLPAHTPPAANATELQEKAVPQPRQDDATSAATKSVKKAAKKTPVKKVAAKKTTAKKAEPPLRELVEAILNNHAGEPRTVSEIREELNEAHPDRATSEQVVRNTVESLARSGRVEKMRQQGSVMYTLPKTATGTADGMVDEETEPAAAHA